MAQGTRSKAEGDKVLSFYFYYWCTAVLEYIHLHLLFLIILKRIEFYYLILKLKN